MRPTEDFRQRLSALEPERTIVERYTSVATRSTSFVYSASNLDGRGDILHTDGVAVPATAASGLLPKRICAGPQKTLRDFVSAMKSRGATVLFSHTPYLIEGSPDSGWREAERRFVDQVQSEIGGIVLEDRNRLFFPANLFFNSNTHLNSAGRDLRTSRAIADLREMGVGRRNHAGGQSSEE